MIQRPTTSIWREAANKLGCDVPAIKAVFEVEAAGKFYEVNGHLPRRFEPHHFPRQHWAALGFNPGKAAPWRASLRIGKTTRHKMFAIAENIDAEAAYRASSWGAPQIMGFNHEAAGYFSAADMVDAFEQGADEQVLAFVEFTIANGLDTHIRSHNWLSFSLGYNGTGQAPVYAAKIESAYRRQSGGKASLPLLRMGSKGAAVRELQVQLEGLGFLVEVDGDFGNGTRRAVREYQEMAGLKIDGVAGAATLRSLAEEQVGDEAAPAIVAPKEERADTVADLNIDKVVKHGTTILGSGGAVGLMSGLNEHSQTILIGGLVVGGIILAALFLFRKRK
jgi:hypothetical protein